MTAIQGEGGVVVIEAVCRRPGFLSVTLIANTGIHLTPMRVLMTGSALGSEPEERTIQILASGGQKSWLEDQRRLMALSAFDLMGTDQWIAGIVMVEYFRLLTCGETFNVFLAPIDELKLAAMMLDVAGFAALIVGPGVETGPGSNAFSEKCVARQAELGCHPLTRGVALETVAVRVDFGVRLAELAR